MYSIIKLIIAVLLLICLADMPYGYYQLVRFVAMIMFLVFAYNYWRKDLHPLAIAFGSLALLFQPFVKIAIGRTMWNIVDVIVALGMVALWLKEYRNRGGD